MPPDELGPLSDTDSIGWIRHLIQESRRLGEHVRDEGRETQRRFDELKAEINELKLDVQKQVAKVDTAQKLTDREMKIKIGSISAIVSAVVTAIIALAKVAMAML